MNRIDITEEIWYSVNHEKGGYYTYLKKDEESETVSQFQFKCC